MARPRRRASADGFTLIEVVIAIAVLGFGLLTLAIMQLQALSQGSAGRHTSDAAAVARTHVEQVMRLPWSELDVAQGIGTWTNPSWAGAGPTVNVNVDMPGGGTAVEHTYNVQWRVTDVGTNQCLRDVEIRVSWAEEGLPANKSFDLATRRYNWGNPTC